MAIYVRDKQGELNPLNIKAIKGKDGITPKITVGEVVTLPAGEKATVEIVGEKENPVINFSIPKGRDGDGAEGLVLDTDKVDYMGGKHETLKETNDANVEYLLRKVNVQKYENSNIVANNSYAKQISNAVLKGVTKYRDKETGEILEEFDNSKNLELVSTKPQILTIQSAKLVLDNREIVEIYKNMGYSNVNAKLSDNGFFVMTGDGGWLSPNKVWKLKPNTTYTIQASGKGVINTTHYGDHGLKSEKHYFNYNKGYIQVVGTTDETGTFGLLLRFDKNMEVDFKVFEGNSNGKLIGYKTSTLTFPDDLELNAVNNDYRDILNLVTGEKNSRVTKVNLKSLDNWTMYRDSEKNNTVAFYTRINGFRNLSQNQLLCDHFKVLDGWVNNVISKDFESICLGHGLLNVRINISKLHGNVSGEGLKQYFQDNDVNIVGAAAYTNTEIIDLPDQKLYSYDGITYYSCISTEGHPSPILAIDVPTDLSLLVSQQKQEIESLTIENEKLKQMDNDHIANLWDIDFRTCEIEWALEDAGLTRVNLMNELNNKKLNLSKYEQAKIMITSNVYNREILTRQLSRYLEKNIITKEEFDELIELMG